MENFFVAIDLFHTIHYYKSIIVCYSRCYGIDTYYIIVSFIEKIQRCFILIQLHTHLPC
jgi:hypothetical protein